MMTLFGFHKPIEKVRAKPMAATEEALHFDP
jgi:hypothetical protein